MCAVTVVCLSAWKKGHRFECIYVLSGERRVLFRCSLLIVWNGSLVYFWTHTSFYQLSQTDETPNKSTQLVPIILAHALHLGLSVYQVT